MTTWKEVAHELGVPVADIGGGIPGILIVHSIRLEWFQASDHSGFGWTVDDDHGINRGNGGWDDITLADMNAQAAATWIRNWAKEYGYTFKDPAAGKEAL
jgi:hypothetical protein